MNAHDFTGLYETYSKKLYTYALWMMRGTQAAEDVIQSVFIKIWQQGDIPVAPGEICTWLYSVTRNRCLDALRCRTRHIRLHARFAQENTDSHAAITDDNTTLELLDHLEEEERTVVYLHFKTGCSYRDIASIVGSSEAAVRVKAFRALEKLRKIGIRD